MAHSRSFAWILGSLLLLALAAPLQAGITPSGNLDPTSTSWWTSGGDSSIDVHIGKTAYGSVTVNLGSCLDSCQSYIGDESGATGVVTVDGSGSTWDCYGGDESGFFVGYSGHGTLNITDGGAVSSTWSDIGYYSGSVGVVMVNGSDSTWTNDYELHVGCYGQGTLNITNGGTVSYAWGGIGYYSGSVGVVTVAGSGSTWTFGGSFLDGDLSVGHYGQGTLNITDGGAVNVRYDTWVARRGGGAGEIHFDGGTLTTGSLLAGATHLTGTGTINTHGLVGDMDLLFDSTHDPNQTLTLNNVTINLTQNNAGALGAGYAGEGTMSIRDGISVESSRGYIGYKAGSVGVVTVAGSGSTWTCDDDYSDLYVGVAGHGTLNITNGGSVTVSDDCYGVIGGNWDSGGAGTGVVTVDGSDSTWNISGKLYVGHYDQGTLNITDGGAVSNTRADIGCYSDSTGVVTVDGSGSTWTFGGSLLEGHLDVGSRGQGTLNITNGGAVSNYHCSIGFLSGSTGEVTVDGSGSTWTNSAILNVGSRGQGTLNITNGGAVSNSYGFIGRNPGSAGVVTIDGNGSTWTNSKSLYVGGSYTEAYGTGLLDVRNGGVVSADAITVWETGKIVLGVSGDYNMLIANGDFTNNGIVCLTAGADLSAGTYTPISVVGGGGWFGTVDYETIGGLWDGTLHTFTVAAPQNGDSGVEITVDLSDAPRLDITDGATGQQVGASFAEGTGTIDFTATAMTDPTGLANLSIMLTSGETILSGWDFNTDLPAGEEVLLSFYVGDGYDTEDLEIWHYDAGNWIAYDAADFAYADGWVSFTVDGFSGYAVTNVPEPVSAVLLLSGGILVMFRRRRK